MNICICDDCFTKLMDMGIIYQFYLEILLQYLSNGSPISLMICDCSTHRKSLQMIYELESRKYINLFEKDLTEILIVPRGIKFSQEGFEGPFICNCEFQL